MVMTAAGSSAAAFSSPNQKRSVRRSSPPPVVCIAPPSGMMAWWRGEGNAIDARGNYNGTLQNGTLFAAGVAGQAFSFDGIDDHVDLADGFANFTNGLTIGLWARPTSNGVWARFIDLGNGQANNNILFERRSTSNDLAFEVYNGSGTSTGMAYAVGAITNYEWHYYAATMDAAGRVQLYKDGVALVMATDTTGVPANVARTTNYIARSNWAADAYYAGGIDEPVIFDRALSSSEIGDIYTAGSLGFCYQCTPRPDGMVSMWAAENNPLDSLGRNNAALRNSTTYAPGIKGQAFSFDGVDDYIEIPDSASLGLIGGLTLEAWVKQRTAGFGTIFSKADDNGSAPITSYGLQINPAGAINAALYGTYPADNWTTGPGLVTVGQWNHIALNWDGTYGPADNVKLYINGSFVQSWTKSGAPLNVTTQTLTIGSMKPPTYYGHLDGLIDEPAIFGRALSAAEITAIYNAAGAGFCGTCTPAPVGLTSWWPGDGNGIDVRGRNNGTMQNGATFAPGKVGQAMSFNGVNQYVSLSNVDFRSDAAGSMGFWVQTTDAGAPTTYGNLKGAFFGRGNSIDQHLHLGIASGKLTIEWYISGHHSIQGTSNIADGNWHYVVFVSDGAGTVRLYVDGGLENSGIFNHTSGSTSTRFGSEYEGLGSYSYFYNGLIDEVEYFNRAISLSEIQAIVNAGSSGKCKPTAATPPAGVVGWWPGDGYRSEFPAPGRFATLVNGAGYAVGKVGQSFSLDGVDDYIEVADSVYDPGSSEFSVEFWLKSRNCGAGTYLVGKSLPDSGQGWDIRLDNNRIQVVGVNGWALNLISDASVTANAWHHIAMSSNTTQVSLYVDGVLHDTCQRQAIGTSVNPLRFGFTTNFGGTPLNGLLDEVTLYNRAITPAEIEAIVNAGLAGKLKQMVTLAPGSMVRVHKASAPDDTGVYAFPGDATILFPVVTSSGMTQQIPLDPAGLPPLPLRTVGLTYDIATSAQYTGTPTVCFNLPSFTSNEFATLHILHLEDGGWVDRTYASSAYPSLCTAGLTSLSPFAIVTTAPTATEVSIAGRVVTNTGRGIRGAFVTVTGTRGDVHNVPTGNLGRYIVTGLTAGETYIVTVRSRRFTFAQPTLVIPLNNNVTDADFISTPPTGREQ